MKSSQKVDTTLDFSKLPDVFNAREAAAFLRLSTDRLAAMRVEGCGPVFIKAGRTVLYARADVENWIRSRVFRSTSAIGKTVALPKKPVPFNPFENPGKY